jgi:hypothetical protein
MCNRPRVSILGFFFRKFHDATLLVEKGVGGGRW